jgi:hypothetical protein
MRVGSLTDHARALVGRQVWDIASQLTCNFTRGLFAAMSPEKPRRSW